MRGAAAFFVSLAACAPTLSSPRSPAFEEALSRASVAHTEGAVAVELAALDDAAHAARRRVDREEAQYRRAMAFRRAGQPEEALSLLDAIAAGRPALRRTHRALLEAAKLRLERGEVSRARAELERLVTSAPEHGGASSAVRLLVAPMAHDTATLEYLERLYVGGGRDGQVGDDLLFERARLFASVGETGAAEGELERLLEAYPYPFGERVDDACWMLADLAAERGDHDAELRALERLVSLYEPSSLFGSYTLPRMPAAALRIATVLRDRGDEVAAEAAFLRVAEVFSESRFVGDAWLAIAELAYRRGDTARSCDALLRVAASRPRRSVAHEAETKRRERCSLPPLSSP